MPPGCSAVFFWLKIFDHISFNMITLYKCDQNTVFTDHQNREPRGRPGQRGNRIADVAPSRPELARRVSRGANQDGGDGACSTVNMQTGGS
jgi:hypothetical protein